jgi:DNA-binding transcriptional MerR regulator
MEAIEASLRSRDEQIAELQQAVIELADMRAAQAQQAAAPAHDAEAQEQAAQAAEARRQALESALDTATTRIGHLEGRLAEQEQAIRHVLTMLIEWFESDRPKRAA